MHHPPHTPSVSKSDPDAGTSTLKYDGNGNTLETTDSRGTLSFSYDASNRKTGEYAAPVTGQSAANQIASWVYDNANNAVAGMPRPIGQLTTSISYDNGSAYTTQALGFNVFGEPLGQTVTVPAAAGTPPTPRSAR